jgi:hypothetical protein
VAEKAAAERQAIETQLAELRGEEAATLQQAQADKAALEKQAAELRAEQESHEVATREPSSAAEATLQAELALVFKFPALSTVIH